MMMITVSVHFCNVLKKLNMLNLIFTCLHWAPVILWFFTVLGPVTFGALIGNFKASLCKSLFG